MKKNIYHYLLITVPLLCGFCKGGGQLLDPTLQAIVDFNETLSKETPSQFAAHNFKAFFEKNAIPQSTLKERPQSNESKTHAFQQSFLKFIKEVYNNKSYANRLSQDASHIAQFFELCNEINLSTDLAYVGIRLFYNKIKACELVDDTVIQYLLNKVPQQLERYFKTSVETNPTRDLAFIQQQTESIILNKFTENQPQIKQHPDIFVSELAKEIAQYFQNKYNSITSRQQDFEDKERLRQLLIRFFDTMLGKAIWNNKAPEGIWQSFTSIANGLQVLGNHNIINHMDDLDDLLWSLTHRFCFFLDLTGSALPTNFYEEVERDLQNKAIFFLEFKEQDAGITTKKETLADALIQAKIKAVAYERRGIISMPFTR